MTDNNGLPVPGYQPQSDDNVRAVTVNKLIEERVLRQIDALMTNDGVDKRWVAIGKTHIEQGFMAINRGVFKPSRVALPEDGTGL